MYLPTHYLENDNIFKTFVDDYKNIFLKNIIRIKCLKIF